ncbi:MAG: restriction endonuclease subunit S [Candidatus Marinimicrobia bacterium]|nr:restriction endonuclease subunit S [Candidatus Neomarinimicrobiota bacterium]
MKWRPHQLRDLCCQVVSGGTPSTSQSHFYGGPIPWLRTQEVTFNRIAETEMTITEDGLANSTAKWVPENSVIVAMYGNSAGRVATNLIPLTTNQACCNLIIDSSKADYRFIFYRLMLDYNVLHQMAKGAAQNNLNAGQIKAYTIQAPSVSEQGAIAEVVSAYDDLIENNRRRMKLLEEAARQLYREWFVRLRFPGHERAKIKNGLPEGWERQPLGDLADVTMGQSPESSYYNETGEGLPFHQGVADFGDRFVSHRVFTTALNRLAEPSDILCSVRAPVGRLNLTLDKIVIGRGLSAIRSRTNHQSLLFYQLRNHFFKEDLIGAGSIFASVTKAEFLRQEILVPPKHVADAFEDVSRPLDDQLRLQNEQNQKLRSARDLLLPKLMSGELAV